MRFNPWRCLALVMILAITGSVTLFFYTLSSYSQPLILGLCVGVLLAKLKPVIEKADEWHEERTTLKFGSAAGGIKLDNVRLAFPDLWPKSGTGSSFNKPRYSASVIVPRVPNDVHCGDHRSFDPDCLECSDELVAFRRRVGMEPIQQDEMSFSPPLRFGAAPEVPLVRPVIPEVRIERAWSEREQALMDPEERESLMRRNQGSYPPDDKQ